MALLVSFAAFLATLLGGFFALKLSDRLHLIVGFSAGAVIGVAFFDLVPEAVDLAGDSTKIASVTAIMAVGFVFYMLLDRTVAPLGDKGERTERLWRRGMLGAASLAVHSFLDGFAIGLAFKVSASVGAVVGAAVLAHDFSDGINTVSIVLRNKGARNHALRWLIVDAVAPVVGAASTFLMQPDAHALGLLLALFAGFFIYIGASDLLPESYHTHPTYGTTATTILGLVVLYAAVRFANL